MCLILVGLFFARPLYRMGLLTIGDYYRARYNRPVEVVTSLCIVISYLGWVSAQDRLLQMELLRRVAAGRVAELVAQHKAAVIAISNDETGISQDPDVRFAVAKKIVEYLPRSGASAMALFRFVT